MTDDKLTRHAPSPVALLAIVTERDASTLAAWVSLECSSVSKSSTTRIARMLDRDRGDVERSLLRLQGANLLAKGGTTQTGSMWLQAVVSGGLRLKQPKPKPKPKP